MREQGPSPSPAPRAPAQLPQTHLCLVTAAASKDLCPPPYLHHSSAPIEGLLNAKKNDNYATS